MSLPETDRRAANGDSAKNGREVIGRRVLVKDGIPYDLVIEKPYTDKWGRHRCAWSLSDPTSKRLIGFEMIAGDSLGAILNVLLEISGQLPQDGFSYSGLKGTGLPVLVASDLDLGLTWHLPVAELLDPPEDG